MRSAAFFFAIVAAWSSTLAIFSAHRAGTLSIHCHDFHANYYLYKQEIARLAAIDVPYYSFSISWNRILPFAGVGTPVNKAGIDHYGDVINTCLEYGIKPVATIVHVDEPYEFIMDGRDVDGV
ncbi:uncharacterized protein ACLA_064280 [Aspergillus clavatus NRRL 1]|uniref:Beta-glucosidase n=1 Tax=Aspergillus clavatus (strain ATCC 1007 / CBS 513.65 / DSM 816 / NCTC 3887 / NRRL 1 / QM 1276 / 107) TaxID=344612 RepID=A1CD50_ASPCL|nr:uncharacterized protein ACLA_064280 [Aspergillus clavatus NRRL 1]EAW12457.1 hypothetical protein ACLA_064280 [Aspergillus clavatus NRRL 1]